MADVFRVETEDGPPPVDLYGDGRTWRRATLWVGPQRVPCLHHRDDVVLGNVALPDFRTRRAAVMFENGWSVSVIWGSHTYSSNGAMLYRFDGDQPPFTEEPALVEVGILQRDAGLIAPANRDCVARYRDTEDVAAILDSVARWSTLEEHLVVPRWDDYEEDGDG